MQIFVLEFKRLNKSREMDVRDFCRVMLLIRARFAILDLDSPFITQEARLHADADFCDVIQIQTFNVLIIHNNMEFFILN